MTFDAPAPVLYGAPYSVDPEPQHTDRSTPLKRFFTPGLLLASSLLLIGTAIAAGFDLKQAFWDKMEKIMQRESKMINGRIRVSEFREK